MRYQRLEGTMATTPSRSISVIASSFKDTVLKYESISAAKKREFEKLFSDKKSKPAEYRKAAAAAG